MPRGAHREQVHTSGLRSRTLNGCFGSRSEAGRSATNEHGLQNLRFRFRHRPAHKLHSRPDPPAPNGDRSGNSLSGGTFGGVDFTGANLSGVVANPGVFSTASFTNANLTGADLSGAIVVGAVWSNTICPDRTTSDQHAGMCVGTPGLMDPPRTYADH